MFDKTVHEVCKERYSSAKKLLEERKELLLRLSERLLEKETLELDELIQILGAKEGADPELMKEYMQDFKSTSPKPPQPQDPPK